jgi:hypothetical protein
MSRRTKTLSLATRSHGDLERCRLVIRPAGCKAIPNGIEKRPWLSQPNAQAEDEDAWVRLMHSLDKIAVLIRRESMIDD